MKCRDVTVYTLHRLHRRCVTEVCTFCTHRVGSLSRQLGQPARLWYELKTCTKHRHNAQCIGCFLLEESWYFEAEFFHYFLQGQSVPILDERRSFQTDGFRFQTDGFRLHCQSWIRLHLIHDFLGRNSPNIKADITQQYRKVFLEKGHNFFYHVA